jgi:nucleotide-binding universal stress UspA family protein
VFLDILVAVDGSEHAAQGLRTAAQLAQEEHARLTVITAVPSAPALAQMSAAGVALTEVADLLGSVSQAVLHEAPVPVLVVRAPAA